MNRRFWPIVGITALFLLIFGSSIARFYTDWLWFGEVGYRSVFWTTITTKLALGVVAGVVFFVILFTNLWLARRLAPPVLEHYHSNVIRARMGRVAKKGLTLVIYGSALGASVLAGMEASSHWVSYQMFTHATDFPGVDPIFGKNIGFYVFQLGFLRYVYGWLLFTLVVTALATAAVHYLDRAIEFLAGMPTFAPHVKAHLSVLLAGALLVKAWGYRLDAYNLLYSPDGVVFGAGYTDVHARLWAYKILSVLAVIAAVLALINIYRRGVTLPVAALAILVGGSFLLGVLYPQAVQFAKVKPDEIRLESKYIKYSIEATREAFDVERVEEREFPALAGLTAKDIENNRPTVNSIRLWDYRPLNQTYGQLQELWQAYDIANVDVDRYTINGEVRQVTVAARELSEEQLGQVTEPTWQNQRLQFTHGYGAVMSPVNRVAGEGLPDFFISGIPPKSSVEIEIDRPQIYYGEIPSGYVIANTRQAEFDYPHAGDPKYTNYAGKGGIKLDSYLKKLAFSMRFSDVNMILPNPITDESRLMFRRSIIERVSTIFPFLMYERDPYLVVSEGRLFWMIDAYTVSNRYPYSSPYTVGNVSINYMRNSVKVVVDAYDGTVDFYTADNKDPVLKTFASIFPGVFKPLDRMPAGLKEHIRYPEMMFSAQAHMLLTYHMQDPREFYAKNDRWHIPKEIVDTGGEQQPVEPYYVVMKLPGERKEEFILMLPFTPANKDNMVAWMAAKCDPEDYGRLILYQFPKDKWISGPAQVESRINQDPFISQQLSLWNQRGSSVNRGNLLVIPIEQSLIYVEPLYLESETSKIPELKRVIVAYGDRIAMDETLDAALARIFGDVGAIDTVKTTPTSTPKAQPTVEEKPDVAKLADQALKEYQRMKELQQKGDWAGYGQQLNRLEETLKSLREAGGQ